MQLEIVRCVADWLRADVNQRIASVPRDAGDMVPPAIATYAPVGETPQVAVFDGTRHSWVPLRKESPVYPALYVMLERPLLLNGEPWPNGQVRATTAPAAVSIRYMTQNIEYARALQDGYYTMRAVARSLRQLDLPANESYRIRNGVVMPVSEDPMEFYPIIQSVGNAAVAGALIVNYMARDTTPSF